MKKIIEIEVEIPDLINPTFIKYLSMLDEASMAHVMGFVGGVLYSSGKISEQEVTDLLKDPRKQKKARY